MDLSKLFTKKLRDEIDGLKKENTDLKNKLSKKQDQINKVNRHWKTIVYNLTNPPGGRKTAIG